MQLLFLRVDIILDNCLPSICTQYNIDNWTTLLQILPSMLNHFAVHGNKTDFTSFTTGQPLFTVWAASVVFAVYHSFHATLQFCKLRPSYVWAKEAYHIKR